MSSNDASSIAADAAMNAANMQQEIKIKKYCC
jgi:hypothetical protein